ncbi:MAG: hypothetical protein OWQ48_01780 [Desulfurococcus sp.]|nr:hypothetical protein [Desulfurococcus sp.]
MVRIEALNREVRYRSGYPEACLLLGGEVARFLQNRFRELKVSEARYEDLLSEADHTYPEYLKTLREQNCI